MAIEISGYFPIKNGDFVDFPIKNGDFVDFLIKNGGSFQCAILT